MAKRKFSSWVFVSLTVSAAVVSGCGIQTGNTPAGSKQVRAEDATQSVTVTIPPGAASMGTTAFGSNPLKVAPGTVVTWVNSDSVAHTATSDDSVWDSKPIEPGQTYSHTFQALGTFRYHSQEAGSGHMSGLINVSEGPDSPESNTPEENPGHHPTPTIIPNPLNPNEHCRDWDRDCDWDGQQQQQQKPKPRPTPKPTKPTPKPTKPTPRPTMTTPVYGPGSNNGPGY